MGRARSDGYRVDCPPPPSTSPKLNDTITYPVASVRPGSKTVSPSRPVPSSTRTSGSRRPGDRRHRHMNRRPKATGCRNPQVRKGIGSCVFMLGIPCLVAGLILTIVSSTDDGGDGQKYPRSFPVLGPILLALSVVCFVTGLLLYNIAIWDNIRDCLGLSDKDSFCRRRFPRLSAWFKPDPNVVRNQTAINNLQIAPARSAMRKIPNPDLVAMATDHQEDEGHPHQHHHGNHHHHHVPAPRRKRAVTFSQGEDSFEGGFVGVKLSSSSEPDRFSIQSENGGGSSQKELSPTSSLLSLRNCRIHPKDEVFWSEASATGSGRGGGVDKGNGGRGDGGCHPAGSDSVRQLSDRGGDHGADGGAGDVSLN